MTMKNKNKIIIIPKNDIPKKTVEPDWVLARTAYLEESIIITGKAYNKIIVDDSLP